MHLGNLEFIVNLSDILRTMENNNNNYIAVITWLQSPKCSTF